MTEPREIEEPVKQLFSQEELDVRDLFNEFYGHLHTAAVENWKEVAGNKDKEPPPIPHGPSVLTDSSFDRMMHERVVVDFVVSKAVGEFALKKVLQDARLREGRVVQREELPQIIIGSLARIRKSGEWGPETRETRKQLITRGLSEHRKYPLISAAVTLEGMLKHDGHEVYAQDVIAASTKWLERVERKKAAILQSHTGDPAA